MVSNGARRTFDAPRRTLITAYLRLLGRRRSRAGNGLGPLRDEVDLRLRGVLSETLGVDAEQLDADTCLGDDLAVDSLDLLDVLMRVEEAFGVVFPERELPAIVTYGDLTGITTALVACRMRARDEALAGPVEVRIGGGVLPRFLRALGPDGYDQEVLRDDLRHARPDELVTVTANGHRPAAKLERALIRASLAGAEVATNAALASDAPPMDDETHAWPAARLVATALAVVDTLGAEREATACGLEGPCPPARNEVGACRAATRERVVAFRAVIEAYVDVLDDRRAVLHDAARELARLDVLRRAVDERATDGMAVRDGYDAITDGLLRAVHGLQSPAAWSRVRLPPRGADRTSAPRQPDRQMLRA